MEEALAIFKEKIKGYKPVEIFIYNGNYIISATNGMKDANNPSWAITKQGEVYSFHPDNLLEVMQARSKSLKTL